MGFADLYLAEIAAEYHFSVEKLFHLCDQLGIAYNNHKTDLANVDAKAIISHILSQRPNNTTKGNSSGD